MNLSIESGKIALLFIFDLLITHSSPRIMSYSIGRVFKIFSQKIKTLSDSRNKVFEKIVSIKITC